MSDLGRNSPCDCGSGKKYKRCCLLKSESSNQNKNNLLKNEMIRESSPRYTLTHPSLPPIFNDSKTAMAYALAFISTEDFFKNIISSKAQKTLDKSLISLNVESNLKCYFSREGDNLHFNIANHYFEAQLKIHADGTIGFLSSSEKITYEPFLYMFHTLFKKDQCPWPFADIKSRWAVLRKVAVSLFSFKNEKAPIFLKGIIINTNFCNEATLHETGEKLERLIFNEKKSEHRNDENYNILTGINEEQENLFYYIKHGKSRSKHWWLDVSGGDGDFSSWNHVQYLFSDNTICNVHELINHSYAVFLPKSLVPENKSIKNKLLNFNFWNEDPKSAGVLKLFLQSFSESSEFKNKDLSLYLSAESNGFIKIDGWDLIKNKNNSLWEMRNNEIVGSFRRVDKTQERESRFSIGEIALVSTESGVHLELNSFLSEKAIFKKIAFENNLKISGDTFNEISAVFTEKSNLYILKSEFDKKMISAYGTSLSLECLEKIPDENIRLNVFLGPSMTNLTEMGFNIEIKILELNSVYTLQKMPILLYRLLGGISEGLGEFYYEHDNKNLATQQQGEKRKNDLKLLRHTGIFKLLISEIIRFNQTPSEQKEKVKDFEKSLVKKAVMVLLSSNEHEDDASLENMISTRVKALVKDLFSELYLDKNLENYIFSNGVKTYKLDLKKPILTFLEAIIEWMDQAYGDLSFSKTNIREIEYAQIVSPGRDQFLVEQDFIPQIFSYFRSAELSKSILSQLNSGLYDLNIAGQKIQVLSEELFSSSIFIGEEEGKINWFDLHPKIFLNGKEVSFDQLQEMKEKNIIFFDGKAYHVNFNKMPKLKFLDRFWAKLKNAKNFKRDQLNGKKSIFRQERSLLLEVLSLRNAGVEIESCAEWKKVSADFDHLMNHQSDDLKRSDFLVPLKDYQKEGTQWIYNLHKIGLGGILADDMGLGKTIQMIGYLELMRLEEKLNFHLIVVPTSLIYNWTSEIKKFAPLLEVEIFESKNKMDYDLKWRATPPGVIIITYGLMSENNDFLNQFNWQSAIYDEAQNLKNITSQRSTAARSLKVQSNFCITGTPMENHYGEFYSLIDLCVPGALGEYQDFMRTFSLEKVSRNSELNSDIQYLKKKISPLVLRRMKSDLLDQLPEKSESSFLIPFEKEQKEIYRNVAISWNDKVKSVIDSESKANTQLQMLTALLRLRQVCSNPAMLENVTYNQIPPKFEMLFSAVEEIYEKGESVLIFTNFINTLQEIEKYFQGRGLRTHSIHGAISAKKRQSELKNFQETPLASILIMTLKTGGVGLNLTKASYVFHIEPWWNPASENQATDRAHRIGQKKSVQVYRYLMKDSVEEKIQDLKNIKGKAFDALFEDNLNESEDDLNSTKAYSGQLSYSDFQHLLD